MKLISLNKKKQTESRDQTKRVSRFTRDPKHPSVQVTTRDLEILGALHSYRLLTTSQIAALFFTTKKRAERRLRQLFDAGLVARIFRPVVLGSTEILYVLDKAGVDLLAAEGGIDRGTINTARLRTKSIKPFFLDHLIEVNQFRLSVTLACESQDLKLLFWRYSHQLQNRNQGGVLISDRVIDPKKPSTKIPVTPDGFFGLDTPQGKAYFFVEIDRGTMDNPRFLRKMRGYARYWLDGVFTEKWGYKAFRVLTTTTTRRVKNLLQTTGKLNEKPLLPIFYFTDRENIAPEHIFTGVWRTPNQAGPKALL